MAAKTEIGAGGVVQLPCARSQTLWPCFVALGTLLGMILGMSLGMCLSMPLGMSLGMHNFNFTTPGSMHKRLTVVETVRSWLSGLQATLKTDCPMGSSTASAGMSLISAPVRSSTLALLPPATTAFAIPTSSLTTAL